MANNIRPRLYELAAQITEKFVVGMMPASVDQAFANLAQSGADVSVGNLPKYWQEAVKTIEGAPEYELLCEAGAMDYLRSVDVRAVNVVSLGTDDFLVAMTGIFNKWIDLVEQYLLPQLKAAEEAELEAYRQGLTAAPKDASEEFVVALDNEGHTLAFDEQVHVHAFLLGGTGSGKSTFMHRFLNEAMRQYSPETLQFYLMDFKAGGVEFNRYARYPHVRALLVDESDPEVTLEILRDIADMMHERGQAMREAGCRDLKEYNAICPDRKMPRLVLVVDECHELFRDDRPTVQPEIDRIVSRMAKEGRSQGVHFIFATQTVASTPIPSAVLNLITDVFLMNCKAADAERLVPKSYSEVEKLPRFGVCHFNNATDERASFVPKLMDDAMMDEVLEAAIKKNAGARLDFTPFYFNGHQTFSIADLPARKTYRRNPEITLGRSMAVRGTAASAVLKADQGQNLLILGIDERHQGFRLLINALGSLLDWSAKTGADARFILIDNNDYDDNPDMEDYVADLRKLGVEVADNRRKRNEAVAELYNQVVAGKEADRPTFVFVSSQDAYSELRRDDEIEVAAPSASAAPKSDRAATEANMFFGGDMSFTRLGDSAPRSSSTVTCQQAWRKILTDGPELGFHTVWQVWKLNRLMFSNMPLSYRELDSMFQHVAFLNTDAKDATSFMLDNHIKLDRISDDPGRLRAMLYNMKSLRIASIVPFALPTFDQLKTLKNG